MDAVFDRAKVFNQDLSKWDTSAVIDMEKSKHTTSVVLWVQIQKFKKNQTNKKSMIFLLLLSFRAQWSH